MRNRLVPYIFVTPAMLLLITFGILPIAVAAVISTTNMNISAFASWNNVDFVGLDNYAKLFADSDFWQALGNTLFGYAAWAWLLARHPAASITPTALLVPLFGMGGAALWLGEDLPAWKLGAAALVIVSLATYKKAPSPFLDPYHNEKAGA